MRILQKLLVIIISSIAIFFLGRYSTKIFKKSPQPLPKPKPTKASTGGRSWPY